MAKLLLSLTAIFATLLAVPTGSSVATAAQSSDRPTVYVDPLNGSDSGEGTKKSPYRSLLYAQQAIGNAGTGVIYLRAGRNYGRGAIVVDGFAGGIRVTRYGAGAAPSFSCLRLKGSNISLERVRVSGCKGAGVVVEGDSNVITQNVIAKNVIGVLVTSEADGTVIIENKISKNSTIISGPKVDDDYGATGIVIEGQNTEVVGNTIQGHVAETLDYGKTGQAIELAGADRVWIYFNRAQANRTFVKISELEEQTTSAALIEHNIAVTQVTGSNFVQYYIDTSQSGEQVLFYRNTFVSSEPGYVVECQDECLQGNLALVGNAFFAVSGIDPQVETEILTGSHNLWAVDTRPGVLEKDVWNKTVSANDDLTPVSISIDAGLKQAEYKQVDRLGYPKQKVDIAGNPSFADNNNDGVIVTEHGAIEAV